MAAELFEYGIQTERSDFRFHVCPIARRIYSYRTAAGVAAINTDQYKRVSAHQPSVNGLSALGHLVPPDRIEGCRQWTEEVPVEKWQEFQYSDSPSVKGSKAVQLVLWLMKNTDAREVTELEQQRAGLDIVATRNGKSCGYQVKCDYRGGLSEFGGTGFLFLQTHERNPLHLV